MRRSETGFTLVELLLAMAVFSFMLVLVTSGYIYLVHIYQAGLASRTTQQNARNVIASVEQTVRDSTQAWVANETVNGRVSQNLCLNTEGNTVEYVLFDNGAPTHYFDLYRGIVGAPPTPPACPAPPSVVGWSKLNDSSVDASIFRAQVYPPFNGVSGSVIVTVGMAARSLLTTTQVNNISATDVRSTSITCTPGTNTQFCATTNLSSAAVLRGITP